MGLIMTVCNKDFFKVDSELILGEAKVHLKKLANVSEASIEDISRERLAWIMHAKQLNQP